MTKEELAQKIKDSNYTCDGINCSECISVNGFGCCLQCDKKLFVSLVLPAKSKKDKLEKRIEELERKLEQTEKDLADYKFNYPTIKELEKENARLTTNEKTLLAERKIIVKENAELKARLNAINLLTPELEKLSKLKTQQLTKAKEHIRTLISCLIDWVQEGDKDYCYIADAEQFIKDSEK